MRNIIIYSTPSTKSFNGCKDDIYVSPAPRMLWFLTLPINASAEPSAIYRRTLLVLCNHDLHDLHIVSVLVWVKRSDSTACRLQSLSSDRVERTTIWIYKFADIGFANAGTIFLVNLDYRVWRSRDIFIIRYMKFDLHRGCSDCQKVLSDTIATPLIGNLSLLPFQSKVPSLFHSAVILWFNELAF